MSFSADVKTELCRTALSRKCCAQAEAYGVLLSGVLHLEEGERKELFQLVRNYLTTHDQPARDKGEHWEYMVMAYRSGNEQ